MNINALIITLSLILLLRLSSMNAIPCAGFDLGTQRNGNDVISDGVERGDDKFDHDKLLSQYDQPTTTLYLTYPINIQHYNYTVQALSPNEANCKPTTERRNCLLVSNETMSCEVTITFNCEIPGQTRIQLSFSDIHESTSVCQSVHATWTKTYGSALIVGTSLSMLDDVVSEGSPSTNFDPSSGTEHLYSQDAYASDITLWFSLKNKTLPQTKKQDFFGGTKALQVAVEGTGGASLQLDKSGTLFDSLATGLFEDTSPRNLTLKYDCKNFGWSTITVHVDMRPFAQSVFAFRKYVMIMDRSHFFFLFFFFTFYPRTPSIEQVLHARHWF